MAVTMHFMNDVVVDNEKLVSTTRASELSGYSKDYVGQLCREDKLFCRRISGHWYVSENSLKSYQGADTKNGGSHSEKKEEPKPESEKRAYGIKVGNVRDDTFSYDGIEYISTLRGSELTGYAQDYIGQLARNGEIEARKVGRRWFVGRATLLAHKKHNDGLLAAVQAEASGVQNSSVSDSHEGTHVDVEAQGVPVEIEIHTDVEPGDINFNVRYTSETDKELVPRMLPKTPVKETYAPGDIDKVPFGHIVNGNPDALIEKNESRPTKAQNSVSRVDAKALPRAQEEVLFTPNMKEERSYAPIIFLGLLVVLLGLLGAYLYFLGLPDALESSITASVDSILSSDLISVLKDSYGDILPGAEFEYTSQ